MVVTRGHIYEYLGMCLNFSTPKEIKLGMDVYIWKAIWDFPEEIMGVALSPAADHLCQIRDPSVAKPLNETLAIAFHHTVVQLLFAGTHAHCNIQVTISFLTTWVRQLDEDELGKSKRALKYLNGTKSLKLSLHADLVSQLHWHINGSHQMHHDCRGHTGAMLTMGKGAMMST